MNAATVPDKDTDPFDNEGNEDPGSLPLKDATVPLLEEEEDEDDADEQ
ncbi:hypothetical protein [Pseudomonas sp. nanlin1]